MRADVYAACSVCVGGLSLDIGKVWGIVPCVYKIYTLGRFQFHNLLRMETYDGPAWRLMSTLCGESATRNLGNCSMRIQDCDWDFSTVYYKCFLRTSTRTHMSAHAQSYACACRAFQTEHSRGGCPAACVHDGAKHLQMRHYP